jgi:hypothetical protein
MLPILHHKDSFSPPLNAYHRGIDQHIPDLSEIVTLPEHEQRQVVGVPVLGGLHHDYRWAV